MVALKSDRADAFIAAPPDAVRMFLVYGSDPGAITERARRLEQIALTRGRGDAVLRLGSDELSAHPARIADEAYATSLFGGEPVISLRVLDGRHNIIGAVQPLLDRPPEAAWLIIEAGELNPTSPLRKGFEASKLAAALPTYGLEGANLTAFIFTAAEAAGVEIGPEALELLSESLGGDRLASRGELDKLFMYAGEARRITVQDVEAIIGETTEAQTDHVIDAALIGDHEALEAGLGRLRGEGGSFVAVGTLALRHLIQLHGMRATLDDGASARHIVESARVHFRRRARIEAQLLRWSAEAVVDARREIDRAIMLTRLLPGLEQSAMSHALHKIALRARRLKPRSAA
jgi:DNA polymerase III subunit delta